jgi:uncharacterized protein (DUF362 family)
MTNFRSRRDFIKSSLEAAGWIAAGAALKPQHLFGQDSTATAKVPGGPAVRSIGPILAVAHGSTETAVIKAIDLLGGMSAFIKPGAVVMIKPNASFPNPKAWGTGTSPESVKTVALEALKAGAGRVIVADNTMRQGMESFNRSGLAAMLAGIDKVKILPLQDESLFIEVEVPNGKALKTVMIAKLIRKADVLINMPCAKCHSATDVSFGLKNNMGAIWNRDYLHTGTDLHAAIAELAVIVKPHLTILDATRALVTNGPTGPGKVQELNTIIAGTDPLAVDAYTTTLANWNNRTIKPRTVRHLALAAQLGVGEIDLDRISILKAEA